MGCHHGDPTDLLLNLSSAIVTFLLCGAIPD